VGKICNEGIVAWMVIANLEFETIFTSYIWPFCGQCPCENFTYDFICETSISRVKQWISHPKLLFHTWNKNFICENSISLEISHIRNQIAWLWNPYFQIWEFHMWNQIIYKILNSDVKFLYMKLSTWYILDSHGKNKAICF
jgi:hypothetical protein